MRQEGQLMLQAICDDIAAMPGMSVVTTLEPRQPFSSDADVIEVTSPDHETETFQHLLGKVDAVLVIAPETGGVLADRCRRVRAAGVASWNCVPSAIELCADKLALAVHLQAQGLPTIATRPLDLSIPPSDWTRPFVLKPQDGAGSCLTFLIHRHDDWDLAVQSYREAGAFDRCLCQPFVSGRTLSVGINISLDGQRWEVLPVAEQHLSDDGRFRYLGGTIPARLSAVESARIQDLVSAACHSIKGLAGYIGLDLILTNDGNPVIVEINPRLTTSYIGYRRLLDTKIPFGWFATADAETETKTIRTGESVEFRLTPS